MRKLLNQPWFAAVLAAVALAFVGYTVLANRTATVSYAAPEADTGIVAEDGTVIANPTGSQAIFAAFKDLSVSGPPRNPFLARIKPAATGANLERPQQPDESESVNVGAVWIQAGSSFALVNGRIVRAGERVGRVEIESVNRDGIWLTHWKGRDFVPVGGGFTLTTPARQAAALAGSSEG